MSASPQSRLSEVSAERIAELENRIARIEGYLGLEHALSRGTPISATVGDARVVERGDLELELGRNWFALAGILALTVGVGFMLSLPHPKLPGPVPSLMGYAAVAGLLALARVWQVAFEAAAGYLRAAAMILFCFAGLRLFYPVSHAVLDTGNIVTRVLLVGTMAASLLFALRRNSPWLVGVALVAGAATLLAVGAAGFVLPGIVAIALVAVVASRRRQWPMLSVAAIPLCALTYLLWALGNPFVGSGAVAFVQLPRFAPAVLLIITVIAFQGYFGRPTEEDGGESAFAKTAALSTCALGYGLFLVHTLVALKADFILLHSAAFFVFLGLAVSSWVRDGSHIATFFYAMTGYAALSLAIMKGTATPDVFVWLSVQSVVVVATAIWFRSRLIVVANFLIYVMIVVGYVITAGKETGISLGFGFVALVTARLLNWQQHRLELKTELMRNAYMLSAFVVFPYALAHLVPRQLVAVAWVGLALAYYAMNLIVQSPKYRWMGHATLLLTMIYVGFAGVRGLDPMYRVLSFLALGAVLLIVSLSITRARRRALSLSKP